MSKSIKLLFVSLASLSVFFFMFCGTYSIPPNGAIPDGAAAVVWRSSGEPIFNSPDAYCFAKFDQSSVMCRISALNAAPTDRIIIRLPYIAWLYHLSV